ncbi:MAG: glycosyltransferase family 39 protein [Pseudomonadota bacterium]|jgi:hypothetical protein
MQGVKIDIGRFDLVGLALLTLLTRVPFMSRAPYDMDSVNFLLGIAHYSPELHQPHPPGYFLYIMAGRLIAALVGDAHLALLILSIVATMLAAWGVYALAKLWYGVLAARFAALILIFSPLAWFHGEVALTYAVEMAFSAWIGWWAWRLWQGEQRLAIPLALLLALAAGFRQSTALFLLPLLVLALSTSSWQVGWRAVLAFVLGCLAWFIPMVEAAGGGAVYFQSLIDLWERVPASRTVMSHDVDGFELALTRLALVVTGMVLALGATVMLLMPSYQPAIGRSRKVFLLVWMVPALAFFVLVFLHAANMGYLLLLAPPLFVLAGGALAHLWQKDVATPLGGKISILLVAGVINGAIFIASPAYLSYASIAQHDRFMQSLPLMIQRHGGAGVDAVIALDEHFYGFRHLGYVLPDRLTLLFPEMDSRGQWRIFSMNHGETRWLECLPQGGFSLLVASLANRPKIDYFKTLLPSDQVTWSEESGMALIHLPSSLLPRLYPEFARQSVCGGGA